MTRYRITASVPQQSAYGSCVCTWSIWSDADPVEERTVVSDNGEQWSPNTPPPATAPKHAYTSVPSSPPVKVNASGSAIGIQIAKVPQEDPVANAMIAEMIKIIAGSMAGVRKLSLKDTI